MHVVTAVWPRPDGTYRVRSWLRFRLVDIPIPGWLAGRIEGKRLRREVRQRNTR